MFDRHQLGDHAAHGKPGDMGGRHVQVIQQGGAIASHVRQLIGKARIAAVMFGHGGGFEIRKAMFREFLTKPDVAVVHSDHIIPTVHHHIDKRFGKPRHLCADTGDQKNRFAVL